jgi:hypothetical protein
VTAPGPYAPHASVVAGTPIHEYTEAISPDVIPLASMATHQPSLSTTDVVPAEEDISPQIAVAFDANVATRSGALSTRSNRHDMVHPVPMAVSRRENEPVSSKPGIDGRATAPGDHLDE